MDKTYMLNEQMAEFVSETINNMVNLNDPEDIRLAGAELITGSISWMKPAFRQKFISDANSYVDAKLDIGPTSLEKYQEYLAMSFVLSVMS